MIVSKKDQYNFWNNSEGYSSRLSGPYFTRDYANKGSWHRLYGRSYYSLWNLNKKYLTSLKTP